MKNRTEEQQREKIMIFKKMNADSEKGYENAEDPAGEVLMDHLAAVRVATFNAAIDEITNLAVRSEETVPDFVAKIHKLKKKDA